MFVNQDEFELLAEKKTTTESSVNSSTFVVTIVFSRIFLTIFKLKHLLKNICSTTLQKVYLK